MKFFLIFLFFAVICVPLKSNGDNFNLMFYNVENLFDCEDDSAKKDEEYLEGGMRAWNFSKYRKKLNNIAKVIVNVSQWEPPAIIGLCEVESKKALTDLTKTTGLRKLEYNFVHFESPDARGIDVALLYRASDMIVLEAMPLNIAFSESPNSKTRDILYVSLLIQRKDTLHLLVCHFPSRLGGEAETNEKRKFVATVVRTKVDGLLKINPEAKIVIMGDMNDYPTNESVLEVIGAVNPKGKKHPADFYNLMFPLMESGEGTHKHESEWGALDQLIVSHSLLYGREGLVCGAAEVVRLPFILEEDEKYFGQKPFRTYNGFKYRGGYSDHLPVKLKINY